MLLTTSFEAWISRKFKNTLLALKLTPEALDEYVDDAVQRIKIAKETPHPDPANDKDSGGEREKTPEGLSQDAVRQFRDDRAAREAAEGVQRRQDAVDAAARARILAKLNHAGGHPPSRPNLDINSFAQLFGLKTTSATSTITPAGFSDVILALAPHLKEQQDVSSGDPHVEQT